MSSFMDKGLNDFCLFCLFLLRFNKIKRASELNLAEFRFFFFQTKLNFEMKMYFLSFYKSGFMITHLVFTPLCHSLMSDSCLLIAGQVVRL